MICKATHRISGSARREADSLQPLILRWLAKAGLEGAARARDHARLAVPSHFSKRKFLGGLDRWNARPYKFFMPGIFSKAREFLRDIGIRFSRAGKISSVAALCEFIATRAAFVSQKTLYGYVQTRMGMEYAKMFQEPAFLESLNIAKMHVFAACLSDLAIYAVAEAIAGAGEETCQALARNCFRRAIDDNGISAPSSHWAQDALGEFEKRLRDTDWQSGALKAKNFTRSPRALVRWSPIAPQLKQHDMEIVENSIKFAWLEVREEFRRRLDRRALAEDAATLPLQ